MKNLQNITNLKDAIKFEEKQTLDTCRIAKLVTINNKTYAEFFEIGFSSETEDGKHVLFFDFDLSYKSYPVINNILAKLQSKYFLSEIYVFKSRFGFNAICLDKFNFHFAVSIKKSYPLSEITDYYHDKMSIERGLWILRYGKDKKLFDIIKTFEKSYWKKSRPHAIFLNSNMGTNINIDKTFDKKTLFKMEKYLKRCDLEKYIRILENV